MNLKDLTKNCLLICLPSSVEWEDYQKELDAVADESQRMYFKVARLPQKKCERCYLCWRGNIVGWMKVTGYYHGGFDCSTTGKSWSGHFIGRTGKFHKITPVPHKSFRGFQYIQQL